MKYYKIVFKETGDVSCYAKTDDVSHSLADVLGLLGEGYVSEEITKEEYDEETEHIDDDDDDEEEY